LKKTGGKFSKKIISAISQNDENHKNISSSLFHYSERTIANTETNDTSEESSDIQLFAAGKFEGVAF
jgi:hypothetical protein